MIVQNIIINFFQCFMQLTSEGLVRRTFFTGSIGNCINKSIFMLIFCTDPTKADISHIPKISNYLLLKI